jgi:AraC-like DNA-binding protein
LTGDAKPLTQGDSDKRTAAEPTIGAGYPKALLMFAVSRGADRQALLDRSGIASQELAEPDARIPLRRHLALFDAAIDLCDAPGLALQFGEAVRAQDISIVGLICEVAETPMEVGRQLNRYARLMVDEGRPADVVRGAPGAEGLWMEFLGETYSNHRHMAEAEMSRLVCNSRAMFGALPAFQAMRFPLAAHFIYPEPAYRAEYERIFGATLVFGADRNALLLDPAFGALRQPPTNRFVFGALSERADTLLKELEASTTVTAQVQSLLMSILHSGDASMDGVAARMAVSRRTLQRKLNAEGVTFEALLDGLRHELALRYLSGRKVSPNETAYLVGYSEPAAFSRAFRRWTGTSPGAYRDRSC